jgi:hypothetical protein
VRWALLGATLAALLLAGCATGPAQNQAEPRLSLALHPTALLAGQFYSFVHGGGPLHFQTVDNATAVLEIFNGADARVGQIELDGGRATKAQFTITAMAAGQPVVRFLAIEGTIRIHSGSQEVTEFMLLVPAIERVLLINRGEDFVPSLQPFVGGAPANELVTVVLQRAPSSLRLLASGEYAGLSVTINSATGPVASTSGRNSPLLGPTAFGGRRLLEIPMTLHHENFGSGTYQAVIEADNLSGALVLEAKTFSRAQPPSAGPAVVSGDEVAFAYGRLTAAATGFQVHPAATSLYFWQDFEEGSNTNRTTAPPAWLAIYDSKDSKIATLRVSAEGLVRLPIQAGGEYVAILLAGTASVGSNEPPADFQLHPLSVRQTNVPSRVAGSNGWYAIESENVTLTGIPFRLSAGNRSTAPGGPSIFGPGMPCGGTTVATLMLQGEAIFSVGQVRSEALQGSLHLQTQGLSVVWDGFGADGCPQPVIAVHQYVRQPLV